MEGLWCGWCKRLPTSQGQTLGDIEEEPQVRRGVIRQAGSRAAGDNGTGRSMGQQDLDGNSVAVRIDFSDVHARSRAVQGRNKSLDPSVFGNHSSSHQHHAGEGERGGGGGGGERRAAGGSGSKSRHRTSDVDEETLKLAGFTPPPKSSLMTGAAPPSPSKSSRSAPTPTPGSPAKRPATRHPQRADDAPELRAALAKAAAAAGGGGHGLVIKPTPSSDGSKASSTRSTKASSRDGPGSWFGMKSALEGIGVSTASTGSAAPSSSSSTSWLGGLGIPAPGVGGWPDMLGGIGGFGSPKEKEGKSVADKEAVEEEAERKIHSQQLEIPSPTANSVGSVSPRKQKKLPPIVLETNSSHHLASGQLSAEEVDKISGALEDMAVSGVITFEEEKHMLDKVAECNPQLLMAWTVFQCNGNEKRFVQTIKSIA